MPDLGPCSFEGIAFHVLIPDAYVPTPVQEVIEAETHVPYSDITIIDQGGLGPWKLSAEVKVLAADQVAWESANGTTGAVILYGTSRGTGKLKILSARMFMDATFFLYAIELVF